MPYSPGNPPSQVKNMPVEAQKIWIDIFNSAWEQYKDRNDREGLAIASAWAGLKKAGWKQNKEDNWVKTAEEHFGIESIIDSWPQWAGSYTKCVDVLSGRPGITNPEALCAWLHHEAEGSWPAEKSSQQNQSWEEYFQTYELKDIEVFSIGEWNKHKITDEDLSNIVNDTNEIIDKLKPKVKLGHDDKQKLLQASGLPAGGWITKLKKVGNKILVDIKEVPKVLYELIKNGAYKRVSSEILYDYTEPSTKKRYAKVLSAIAFLGGDLPAVTNLKDIAALYDADENANLIIYEKEEKIKRKEIYIMPNKIKITELEGQKFVAVEDFEKVTKEAEENKDYKVKFEAEEKKAKEKEAELAKISKEKREAEIKVFTDSHCSEKDMRFLPKQKEILMTLIESTSDEKKIKFMVDKKEVELSQRELLEKFIELQPNFSDKIFAELSKDKEEEGEGDEKLTPEEKKVQKYMAEHKDVKYRDAVLAVLKTTEEKKK